MTLTRSFVVSVIAAAAWIGSTGCGPASAPGAAPVAAPTGAQQQAADSTDADAKAKAKAKAKADRQMAPLALLGDAPVPKAQPNQPVSKQGWLGVALGPHPEGAVINRVVPGSPSERAGLEQGDVIASVAGVVVRGPADVVRIVAEHQQGERLPIGLSRDGESRLLAVELAGRPVDMDIARMSFVGQPAPEFGVLRTVQGSVTPTLQALRGKVVVLEFWASWCSVCRYMVPTLNEWQARFGPQGAVVLGVTVDSVTVASNAANQLGMDYALASDHEGVATRAYAANSIPALYIIDQRGTVREVVVGYSEARLEAAENLIDTLLDGS